LDKQTEMKHYRLPWMNNDQWESAQLLRDLFHGWHHLPGDIKQSGSRAIHINIRGGNLSTFDYNNLTVLVVLAHDRMIRAEICSSGPGMVKLMLHKRHQRVGDMALRHPTLADAVASIRKSHPAPVELFVPMDSLEPGPLKLGIANCPNGACKGEPLRFPNGLRPNYKGFAWSVCPSCKTEFEVETNEQR
jgi:hypothetical protein